MLKIYSTRKPPSVKRFGSIFRFRYAYAARPRRAHLSCQVARRHGCLGLGFSAPAFFFPSSFQYTVIFFFYQSSCFINLLTRSKQTVANFIIISREGFKKLKYLFFRKYIWFRPHASRKRINKCKSVATCNDLSLSILLSSQLKAPPLCPPPRASQGRKGDACRPDWCLAILQKMPSDF